MRQIIGTITIWLLPIVGLVAGSWNEPSPNQYHIQTDEGPERYFRFQTDNGQFRKEKRLQDGTVIGTEAWIDAAGYLRQKDYIADSKGYRILKSKTVFVGIGRQIEDAIRSTKASPAQSGILVDGRGGLNSIGGGSKQHNRGGYVYSTTTSTTTTTTPAPIYEHVPSSLSNGELPPGAGKLNYLPPAEAAKIEPQGQLGFDHYPDELPRAHAQLHGAVEQQYQHTQPQQPIVYIRPHSSPVDELSPENDNSLTAYNDHSYGISSTTPAYDDHSYGISSTTPSYDDHSYGISSTTPSYEDHSYGISSTTTAIPPPPPLHLALEAPAPTIATPSLTMQAPFQRTHTRRLRPIAVVSTTPAPISGQHQDSYDYSNGGYSSPAPFTRTSTSGYRYTPTTPAPLLSPDQPSNGGYDYYTPSSPFDVNSLDAGLLPPLPARAYRRRLRPVQQSNAIDASEYDGVSVTRNGFRYVLPRQYHEEEQITDSKRAGSFGYVDPFGIRRVVYYNASPERGFVHRNNNQFVGLGGTPYDHPGPVDDAPATTDS